MMNAVISLLIVAIVVGILVGMDLSKAKKGKRAKKFSGGVFSSMSDEELKQFFKTCKEKMASSDDDDEELSDVFASAWKEVKSRGDVVRKKYEKLPVSGRDFPTDEEIKKYDRGTLLTFSAEDLDFLFHYIDEMVRLGYEDFRDVCCAAFMVLIERKSEAQKPSA